MTHEARIRFLPDIPNSAEIAQQIPPGAQWWDRTMFISESEGDPRQCQAVIDITGQARYLVYGPFIPLQPGRWRATAFLHVSPDAARRPLSIQFGAEPDYTTVELPFGVPGDHKISVEHVLNQSEPVQIRLWLKRAAFEGAICFFGAALELRTSNGEHADPIGHIEDV